MSLRANVLTAALTACLLASARASTQIAPPRPSDPLARIRSSAAANAEAGSLTSRTLSTNLPRDKPPLDR